MGKKMNRFLSSRGNTGGLVREQQITNDLLSEILEELKRRPGQEPDWARAQFVPTDLPPGVYPAGPPLRQRAS